MLSVNLRDILIQENAKSFRKIKERIKNLKYMSNDHNIQSIRDFVLKKQDNFSLFTSRNPAYKNKGRHCPEVASMPLLSSEHLLSSELSGDQQQHPSLETNPST
jgi:hypothetical protein